MQTRRNQQAGIVSRPPVFLVAEWRSLAMLNYEIDPSILGKYVPAGTELDFWDGRCFVSVVGLLFLHTRVLGVSFPFHRNFEELNLRFYVHREAEGQVRRGVVFIKEIVPRRAVALVARRIYNENYFAMPMRHNLEMTTTGGDEIQPRRMTYEWLHRGRWNRAMVQVTGEPFVPAEESGEAFVTEHYWGYTPQWDGSTLEYEVEHPRWRVWRADGSELDCDVEGLYGHEFAPYLRGRPASAFLADGSGVIVRRGVRILG